MATGHRRGASLLAEDLGQDTELVQYQLTRRKRIRYLVLLGTLIIIVAGLALTIDAALDARNSSSPPLPTQVRLDAMMTTLRDLEGLATSNGMTDDQPTRAVGTEGFNATRDYLLRRLREDTNLVVEVQHLSLLITRELQDSELASVAPGGDTTTHTRGVDFNPMTYQGSGDVRGASYTEVAAKGCEATDFAGFPSGDIAVVYRGACDFGTKATNAENAGAVGCLIVNYIPGVLSGTCQSPQGIPVFGASMEFGERLLALPNGTTLNMFSDVDTREVPTCNILADTLTGSADSIVVVGAHMDSVPAGPGINDNGSGSAAVLEMAIQTSKREQVRNKVRFAWWGAEEEGLVGSTYYVDTLLSGEEQVLGTTNISQIALNLNFDMLASPNYKWGVYNGSSGDTDERTTYGSARIQSVLEGYMNDNGHPFVLSEFDGRSDYGPFIRRGANVPAGGLDTGAEKIKSVEERAMFGGLANAAYDTCYHQSCDTVDNISQECLVTMAQAAAHAVSFFADQPDLQQWLTPPLADSLD